MQSFLWRQFYSDNLEEIILNYTQYFEKTIISETSVSYRWDLNKVPTGCEQITLLAELINHYKNEGKLIKLRPDTRKRAKGLIVVFINDKDPLQQLWKYFNFLQKKP